MNLEEQYDRIYKYLYYRLHDRNAAEDLTQETFLRFLGSRTYRNENRQLQYLYTIACNLCSQHYRDKTITYSLDEEADAVIEISAATGEGINDLFEAIENALRGDKVYIERIVAYSEGELFKRIRKYGEVLEEEYLEDGVSIKAYVPNNLIK